MAATATSPTFQAICLVGTACLAFQSDLEPNARTSRRARALPSQLAPSRIRSAPGATAVAAWTNAPAEVRPMPSRVMAVAAAGSSQRVTLALWYGPRTQHALLRNFRTAKGANFYPAPGGRLGRRGGAGRAGREARVGAAA